MSEEAEKEARKGFMYYSREFEFYLWVIVNL